MKKSAGTLIPQQNVSPAAMREVYACKREDAFYVLKKKLSEESEGLLWDRD